MLAEIEPKVRIFNLETGYQFPETLALRDRIADQYGIEVELIRPETTVAEYEARHKGPLYVANPDQCCHDRQDRAVAGPRSRDMRPGSHRSAADQSSARAQGGDRRLLMRSSPGW